MNLAKILQQNLAGKLLNHVLVFFINILLVRFLGAGESGNYFNELYILNGIVFVSSLGLDYVSINLLAEDPRYLSQLRKFLFLIVISFSVFWLCAVLFLLPHFFPSAFQQPSIAIILFSIANLLLIFYQGLLSAFRQFNLQNILLLFSNGLFICFLLLANEISYLNPRRIYIAYASLFFIQGLMMYFFASIKRAPEPVSLDHRSVFAKGILIMLSSLAYFFFLRIDNFYVEKYCDKITLGNYIQCGKTGQYFLYFSSIISSTLLPFIAKDAVGASFREWLKLLKPYLFLISLAALFIAFTGRWIFPFLFGEEFINMHQVMIILLPGYVCLGLLTLINAVYIGKGRIMRILVGDILGLLLVATLDWFFVPLYGVWAAAIISSVSYILIFVFLLAGFRAQFRN